MVNKKRVSKILILTLLITSLFSGLVFAADMEKADDVTIKATAHIQTHGDVAKEGKGEIEIGTTGESKRIEALKLDFEGLPKDMKIRYKGHVEKIGDVEWVESPAELGTRGEAKRLERLAIELVDEKGNPYPGYSVEYQVHMRYYGWGSDNVNNWRNGKEDSWAKDGEWAGTEGEALRLEAVRVKILKDAKLAVTNVSADNLKEIEVIFNNNVEGDAEVAKAANYKLAKGTVESVVVDGRVATLRLKDVATQQSKTTLTVSEKILDKKEDFTVEFFDNTPPVVVDAQAVGSHTMKVTFTEPIKEPTTRSDKRAAFTVKDSNDKKNFVKDVEFVNNGREANVELYTKLEEGEYTVQVENRKLFDYAGFAVAEEKMDVFVIPEKDAPQLIGYDNADQLKVTLIFDRDIKLVSKAVGDFYHTNSSNIVKQLPKVDGNKLTLEFDNKNALPTTAYVYVAKGAIQDLWGNKNDERLWAEVGVEYDYKAPEVTKVESSDQNRALKVTFNKNVTEDSAIKRDNYKLLDKNDKEVKNIITSASLDGKVVKLTLRKEVIGEYTLVVKGVKDLYGNEMDEYPFAFYAKDIRTLDISKAIAKLVKDTKDEQVLTIDFGRQMAVDGVYSVIDLAKYKVKTLDKDDNDSGAKELSKLKGIDIVSTLEDRKIVITNDITKSKFKFNTGKGALEIARVADAAGNKTSEFSTLIDILGVEQAKVGADTVEAIAKDEIKITLKDELVEFDMEDFRVVDEAGNEIIEIIDADEDVINGKTILTFKLEKKLNADGTYSVEGKDLVVYVDTVPKPVSENAVGEKVEIKKEKVKDSIAPSLKEKGITAENNVIKVEFDEALSDTAAALIASDLVVLVDGEQLSSRDEYKTTVEGSEVIIEVTKKTKETKATSDVTVQLLDGKYVTDKAGNIANKFGATKISDGTLKLKSEEEAGDEQ